MRNSKSLFPIKERSRMIITFFIIFLISSNLSAAAAQCRWTGVEKIIAVGDIHGDYENFVQILRGTGLVDEHLHWIAGETHFVQIGDIMDRGHRAKDIFDLLIRLEKEAEQAGGKIHLLLGNHEEMNITGIAFDNPGYVTLGQFLSFLPEKFKAKKEKEFMEKIENKGDNDTNPNSSIDSSLIDYWEQLRNEATRNSTHPARKEYTSNFNKKYGKWIIEHKAVIKINDIIFVHGGISEKFSQWKLEDINNRLRNELRDLRIAYEFSQSPLMERKIVFEPNGPLWYRELAILDEEEFKEDFERILFNLDAKHMVIAHTPQDIKMIRRYDGMLWSIDTGISKFYGSHLCALIVEDGNFRIWPPGVHEEEFELKDKTKDLLEEIWSEGSVTWEVSCSDLCALIPNNKCFWEWGKYEKQNNLIHLIF